MAKKTTLLTKAITASIFILPFILILSAHNQRRTPDVPYVPTPQIVVDEMLAMLEVKPNDLLYDLGCGDGRIVVTAAKTFGCRAVGIDINPVRIAESLKNAEEAGVMDKVKFLEQDLFETDFSEATVMTLYLLSTVNLRLRPKLLRSLKPGTRVVSHDFSMGDWEADSKQEVWEEERRHYLYYWVVPANISGTWSWKLPGLEGEKDYSIEFKQQFQEVTGSAKHEGSSQAVYIEAKNLKGSQVEFTIERKRNNKSEFIHCEGQVRGHIMEGTAKIEGRAVAGKWRAERDPSTVREIDETK